MMTIFCLGLGDENCGPAGLWLDGWKWGVGPRLRLYIPFFIYLYALEDLASDYSGVAVTGECVILM